MKKSILFSVVTTVITALLCVTCFEYQATEPSDDVGATAFNNMYNGCPSTQPNCPGYVAPTNCLSDPTAPGCEGFCEAINHSVPNCPDYCPSTTPNCPGYVAPDPCIDDPTSSPNCQGYCAAIGYSDYGCEGYCNTHQEDQRCGGENPCAVDPDPSCNNYCQYYGNAVDQCRTYTIAFDANGATAGDAPTARTEVGAGSSITIPNQGTLTRSGYNFVGWNSNSSGDGINYSAGSSYSLTGTATNITLYAKWEVVDNPNPNPTTYRVTFDRNSGSGNPPGPYDVNSGDGITIGSGQLTRNGYNFSGWSECRNDISCPVYPVGSFYTPTGTNTNVTLWAMWSQNLSYGGMSYKTVRIGNQTWMAENLNYDIPNDNSDVCYDDDCYNYSKYGRLYDWVRAMGGSEKLSNMKNSVNIQGICPVGWHLPNDEEWATLANNIANDFGDPNIVGGKLKSETGWYDNGNGTDAYGFSALPGGSWDAGNTVRDFIDIGLRGCWWSSTPTNAGDYGPYQTAIRRRVNYNNESLERGQQGKASKLSVRCVKND